MWLALVLMNPFLAFFEVSSSLSTPVWALASAPEHRGLKALHQQVSATHFKGRLDEGFHFNAQAPNLLIEGEKRTAPLKMAPREIEFALSGKTAEIRLFICDDPKTFCEPVRISLP